MKELVVLSGKGGTGKTSITASLARLAQRPVVADCDVDAADLHLVLSPKVREQHVFMSGHLAQIRQPDCSACGECFSVCRFDAITQETAADGSPGYRIDPTVCEGCSACLQVCPDDAIDFPDRACGHWMIFRYRSRADGTCPTGGGRRKLRQAGDHGAPAGTPPGQRR